MLTGARQACLAPSKQISVQISIQGSERIFSCSISNVKINEKAEKERDED